MTRLFAALAAATVLAAAAPAEDKKVKEPIVEIPTEKADKIETKDGKATAPTAVTSEKELEKAIPDEDTRKRVAKLVDFKEQVLLVFAWEGSGGDKLEYVILESFPEQIRFSLKPGATDDLRKHVKLFALRNNVKWSAK
jgi:hypothetical protein